MVKNDDDFDWLERKIIENGYYERPGVWGLDIFEHLNPNKLNNYLSRIFGLMSEGGYLYANIPAYGEDAVFGEIFKINYRDWESDVAQGRCFRAMERVLVARKSYYLFSKNADTAWNLSILRALRRQI